MVRKKVRTLYDKKMVGCYEAKAPNGRQGGRGEGKAAKEAVAKEARLFILFQVMEVATDVQETHHDGLVIQMASLKEDMREMVHVCLGLVETNYDLDIQALFEMFSPRAPALEGVVAPFPLDSARGEREEEIEETLVQRGGGSANPDLEKETEWKIKARKN